MSKKQSGSETVSATKDDLSFFRDVGLQLQSVSETVSKEVLRHVDYLAEKTQASRKSILGGEPFKAHHQIIDDARKNIQAAFEMIEPESPQISPVHPSMEDLLNIIEQSLEGWCSREKANAIVGVISSEKPQVCVEIGIYGGRSLFPAAAALRENGTGVIFGIDTWSPDVATEFATNQENDAWWEGIDFSAIKSGVFRFIAEHGFASTVRIIEAPSADAAALFSAIDYLHIDGAHSVFNAAEDVVLYAKKVRRGGIILLDDANWPTTQPAQRILETLGDPIWTLEDENGSATCIMYRKR